MYVSCVGLLAMVDVQRSEGSLCESVLSFYHAAHCSTILCKEAELPGMLTPWSQSSDRPMFHHWSAVATCFHFHECRSERAYILVTQERNRQALVSLRLFPKASVPSHIPTSSVSEPDLSTSCRYCEFSILPTSVDIKMCLDLCFSGGREHLFHVYRPLVDLWENVCSDLCPWLLSSPLSLPLFYGHWNMVLVHMVGNYSITELQSRNSLHGWYCCI